MEKYITAINFMEKYAGKEYKSASDKEIRDFGERVTSQIKNLDSLIIEKFPLLKTKGYSGWQTRGGNPKKGVQLVKKYLWKKYYIEGMSEDDTISLFVEEKEIGKYCYRVSYELVNKTASGELLKMHNLSIVTRLNNLGNFQFYVGSNETHDLKVVDKKFIREMEINSEKIQVGRRFSKELDDAEFEKQLIESIRLILPLYECTNTYQHDKEKYLEDLKKIEGNVVEGMNDVEVKIMTKDQIELITEYITNKGFIFSKDTVKNFYLCLKSKPFVILAGISGTGKTRLVKLFAEAIGAECRLVPVRPDWSDSSDLIGHLDLNSRFIPGEVLKIVKEANKNQEKKYILCLDEMNLARVEYYFSEFLSIIETRDFDNGELTSEYIITRERLGLKDGEKSEYERLTFPANLYIVGTVNMDETTFPFSKKVLDRANTIEFNDVNLIPNFEEEEELKPVSTDDSFLKTEYLKLIECEDKGYVKDKCTELQEINEILKEANENIGYRVRDEIVFYLLNNKKAKLLEEDDAFDFELMQKILPRIQGSSQLINNLLKKLFVYICPSELKENPEDLNADKMRDIMLNNKSIIKYKRSAAKIEMMTRRFEEDGFTSYWL